MKENKFAGNVKKESFYMMIGVALMVGFLGGVFFGVYKSPGENGGQPSVASQAEDGGHNIPELEEQVKATPNDAEAWIYLGNAYFDSEQLEKSIKSYNRALEIVPGNPNVLTDLGVMYRRNGQPDQALISFDKAIKADPTHEQSRLNKGVVLLYDKQDQTEAFKTWEELLAFNPMAQIPSGQPLRDFMEEIKKQ